MAHPGQGACRASLTASIGPLESAARIGLISEIVTQGWRAEVLNPWVTTIGNCISGSHANGGTTQQQNYTCEVSSNSNCMTGGSPQHEEQ